MARRGGMMTAAIGVAGLLAPGIAGSAPGAAPAAATPDPVQAGAEAWGTGDYARALGIWRPLADKGDADAQYDLAQAYRLGRGVAVDQKLAQDWYYKAAVQNHPQAQANYGLLLFQNGERKAALPWLRKAADRGDPRAQYVVGTALFNGDVTVKDWPRAYALMTRAAAAGLPPARTSLAEMDKYVPLAQRAQGMAIARDLDRSATLALADEAAGQPTDDTATLSPMPAPPTRARHPATARLAEPAAPPAPPVTRPAVAVAKAASPPAAIPATTSARPAAAPPGTSLASAGGGWRVQIGAYADPAAAGRMWAGVAAAAPGLRPYMVKAGAVTRLQIGPLASRADAARACGRIKAASGTACFPVPAN